MKPTKEMIDVFILASSTANGGTEDCVSAGLAAALAAAEERGRTEERERRAVVETEQYHARLDIAAANKAEAILRVVRKMIAAELSHAEKPINSEDRQELDFLLSRLLLFSPSDVDEALRVVRRRRRPSAITKEPTP